MNQYNINPASRGVNNFFESLTNSSNPQYIQPINTSPPYQMPAYRPVPSEPFQPGHNPFPGPYQPGYNPFPGPYRP